MSGRTRGPGSSRNCCESLRRPLSGSRTLDGTMDRAIPHSAKVAELADALDVFNRGASPRRTPQRRRSRGPLAPLRSGERAFGALL
jgi:hypothetical protein